MSQQVHDRKKIRETAQQIESLSTHSKKFDTVIKGLSHGIICHLLPLLKTSRFNNRKREQRSQEVWIILMHLRNCVMNLGRKNILAQATSGHRDLRDVHEAIFVLLQLTSKIFPKAAIFS